MYLFYTGIATSACDEGNIKIMPLLCTVDLDAKAHFLKMHKHNGSHSCKDCLVNGQHVPSGGGQARCFPFPEAIKAEKRTDEGCIRDGFAAMDSHAVVSLI